MFARIVGTGIVAYGTWFVHGDEERDNSHNIQIFPLLQILSKRRVAAIVSDCATIVFSLSELTSFPSTACGIPHHALFSTVHDKTPEIDYCTMYSSCKRDDHWFGFRLTT
jgi:hypothetical protein